MRNFPTKRETVTIEGIDREVVLKELTVGYIKTSQSDPEYDTPMNALKMCGLEEEEIVGLGTSVVNELYEIIIELTYPEMMAKRKQMIEDGTYVPESDEEVEESKKNSQKA